MTKKAVLFLMMTSLLMLFSTQSLFACEINFDILKGKKAIYETGDQIVVKVNVLLTHRACPISLKKTQFKLKGLKVVKSTKWKKKSPMKYERKLMINIKDTKDGKLMLTAIRTCDKDGGFGTLKLKSSPKK